MNTSIKTALAAIGLLVAFCCKKENSNLQSPTGTNVSDIVTGKYPSVLIGTQRWMTKNLNVRNYRNGDKIPQVKDSVKWAKLTTGAWCWYKNDSTHYAAYGKLYNWYAVNDPRGLAPTGWHIPSDAEWDTLSTFLGNNAGGKLKDTGTIEAGTGLWYAPNSKATNKTGFTGLPGGHRDRYGTFYDLGIDGYWWSSTEGNTFNAWDRSLIDGNGSIYRFIYPKHYGFSVRCLRN